MVAPVDAGAHGGTWMPFAQPHTSVGTEDEAFETWQFEKLTLASDSAHVPGNDGHQRLARLDAIAALPPAEIGEPSSRRSRGEAVQAVAGGVLQSASVRHTVVTRLAMRIRTRLRRNQQKRWSAHGALPVITRCRSRSTTVLPTIYEDSETPQSLEEELSDILGFPSPPIDFLSGAGETAHRHAFTSPASEAQATRSKRKLTRLTNYLTDFIK